MERFWTLVLMTSLAQFSTGQYVTKCYQDHVLNNYFEYSYPGFQEARKTLFLKALDYASHHSVGQHAKQQSPDTIYRFPVVVHIVYNEAAENLDEQLIQDQIDVLTRDFRRKNADTSDLRSIFLPVAADAGIEFFLADIDPNGNPTNGITRTNTSVTSFGSITSLDLVKDSTTGGKNAWPTDEYLNIWVCDLSIPLLGDAALGFAYPPIEAPNWPSELQNTQEQYEGIVIHYKVFGPNNPLATGLLSIADQGRTPVHEMGHYLGLRHIWGDAGNPLFGGIDCDPSLDDGFDDTPNAGNNSQATGCDKTKNSCGDGDPNDLPDMIENYMDYSTESCQVTFTSQQAGLMRAMVVIGKTGMADVYVNDVRIIDGKFRENGPSTNLHALEAGKSTIYPNPSADEITITWPSDVKGRDISIYSVDGIHVASNIPQTKINTMDISSLLPGHYIVQIEFTNGIKEFIPLIKQ